MKNRESMPETEKPNGITLARAARAIEPYGCALEYAMKQNHDDDDHDDDGATAMHSLAQPETDNPLLEEGVDDRADDQDDDDDIGLEAVKQNVPAPDPVSFEYAAPEHRADRAVVFEAVKQKGTNRKINLPEQ